MSKVSLELTMMKRIGELNAENARLKAEVERSRDQYNGIIDTQLKVIEELKAEVERLTKENETINKDRALLWASHKIALQDIQGLHYALQTAKEGKPQP